MPGIGRVKNTESAHAMKEAAEASKKAAQKAEEGKTVEKNDDVQISDKATKLSKPDNAEKTAEVKNADTKIEDTSKQVTASEKSEKGGKHSENTMKSKIEKLSSFVKELRTSGISSREISKIIRNANRKNNESIGKEIKQAYTDYKDKKISADDFKNKLYKSAVKKVDGMTSALQELHSKVTFSANKSESSSPSFANKENGAIAQTPRQSIFAKKDEPAHAEKAATENKEKSEEAKQVAKTKDKIVMDAKPAITAQPEITEKATPPGLAKKEEIPPGQVAKDEKAGNNANADNNVNVKLAKELRDMLKDLFKTEGDALKFAKKEEGPGNADKVLGEIVGMFHEMDKMVNGLDKNLDEDGENKGFGNFVAGLKNMFSEIGSTESNSFLKNLNKVAKENGASDAHKVGMEQIKADTLSSIFKGGETNSSLKINRVGDNGDGSGNFSAAKFMSEVSTIIESGLDSYKGAKEAREAAGENRVKQENAETELSSLA